MKHGHDQLEPFSGVVDTSVKLNDGEVANKITDTITERELTHGSFRANATIAQNLKTTCRYGQGYTKLSFVQKESLDMICHKIARIVNGNPDTLDHWHDVAGYAQLVERNIKE